MNAAASSLPPPPLRTCYYLAWGLSDVAGHLKVMQWLLTIFPDYIGVSSSHPLTTQSPQCHPLSLFSPALEYSTHQPHQNCMRPGVWGVWGCGGPAASVLLYRPIILLCFCLRDYFQSLSSKISLREELLQASPCVFVARNVPWLIDSLLQFLRVHSLCSVSRPGAGPDHHTWLGEYIMIATVGGWALPAHTLSV